MLTHTFRHIRGVGTKIERRLWREGIGDWDALFANAHRLPRRLAWRLVPEIQSSLERLEAGDAAWFAQRLPASEHWRLFPEFRHSVAYLDIETTGMGGPDDYITAVAIYDGGAVHNYVQGENLFDFRDEIDRYDLLVTYNGKCFDLPFIRSYFGHPMRHAHIDLRYVLASLGYRGGLKGCERQLGLERGELEGVDGYFAVLLWWDYLNNGNERALETLLAYNCLDVVNLEVLMVVAYNLKVAATPFGGERQLPLPEPPPLPFRPDPGTIARLRQRLETACYPS